MRIRTSVKETTEDAVTFAPTLGDPSAVPAEKEESSRITGRNALMIMKKEIAMMEITEDANRYTSTAAPFILHTLKFIHNFEPACKIIETELNKQ